jgi:hypothetical protein
MVFANVEFKLYCRQSGTVFMMTAENSISVISISFAKDTGGKLATGVNDASGQFAAGVNKTGGAP